MDTKLAQPFDELRRQRRRLDLTQATVALRVRIAPSRLCAFERGVAKLSEPQLSRLIRFLVRMERGKATGITATRATVRDYKALAAGDRDDESEIVSV